MTEQTLEAQSRGRGITDQVIDRVWSALTSVRLALILILAIATASFVGAAIAQAPPPALDSEQQFSLWFESVRGKYVFFGLDMAPAFERLQFFQVFTSGWFRALITLLAANVFVCTLNRTPRVLQMVRRDPETRVAARLFDRAPLRVGGPVGAESIDGGEAAARAALRRHRFGIRAEREDGVVHLVGEKNRYWRLGTLVSHAGIVTVLLGAVFGGTGGFRESQFVIAEGQELAIGHETGLTIRLDSFVDEYYAGGGGIPKDYRSNVVLLRDGEEVRSGTVRVNEPVIYQGVRVHQSYYGPAVVLQISDPQSGRLLYDGSLPLHFRAQERPAGSLVLSEPGLELFVVGPASAFVDPVIRPGEIRLEVYRLGGTQPLALQNVPQGAPQVIGDLQVTFLRESRFSGLQIVKDPALPLVWLGSAMLVLGSIAVLYFPHRRIWVRVDESRPGDVQVRLAAPRERGLPFDGEFRRIARGMGLRPRQAGPAPERG